MKKLILDLVDVAVCEHCGQTTLTPFSVIKIYEKTTKQHTFCSEVCAHESYIKKLREGL